MSKWSEHEIHAKLTDILGSVQYDHHFGRPYITAYQLAINLYEKHPDIEADLALPVGGSGAGQRHTLAKYLANVLSQAISAGRITNIEGAFLSSLHLNEISFNTPTGVIVSSLTQTPYPVSMYRLKEA